MAAPEEVPEDGPPSRGNLPVPATSFVGRHAELAAAESLLRGSRLVTLTGPGGTGKTRLAIELATTLQESFPDGAWLVELEAVTDPAAVPDALAAALGVGGKLVARRGRAGPRTAPGQGHRLPARQGRACRARQLRAPDRGVRAGWYSGCSGRRPGRGSSSTSRERLGVAGRRCSRCRRLACRTAGTRLDGQIARSEAVQLFADRGRRRPAARSCSTRAPPPPCLASAAASTAYRWRSSWPPPGCAILPPCRSRRALTTASTCSPRGTGERCRATRRCARPSTGATGLLAGPERELFGRLSVFAGGFTPGGCRGGVRRTRAPATAERARIAVPAGRSVPCHLRGPRAGAVPHARDAAPLRGRAA